MNHRIDRRSFMSGLAGSVATIAGTASAHAESPLKALFKFRKQSDLKDRYDSALKTQTELRSEQPTLSSRTVANVEFAIERYTALQAQGGWPEVRVGPRLRLGMRDKLVYTLRRRLVAGGDLDPGTEFSNLFDSDVDVAVRRFQSRHGLAPSGELRKGTYHALNVPIGVRIRQLQTNLVRLRSLSGYLGDRYVMTNIPAADIETVSAGLVQSRHTAVVGKIDRQTPILNSQIVELNFNPYWHVPVSIIRKDLIPKMRQDPDYLTRNKIRIYDQTGSELDPTTVDWQTDEATKYLFRQDPGEINSMGSMRINFPNPHSVYMHDTPSKSLFGQDYRFHSSGCVRVQDIRGFASWLLQDTEGWSRETIDSTIASGERLDVKLADPVPLYFTYVTAWATANGVVNFRDDIYRRDDLGQFAQSG